MEITEVQPADLDTLHTMFEDYLREFDARVDPRRYYDRQELARYLDSGRMIGFLARHVGDPAGFVLVQLVERWYHASSFTGVIEEMYVAAPFRRRGTGTALVSHAIETLRARGASVITAPVLRTNMTGLLFWQRIGFTIEAYGLYLSS